MNIRALFRLLSDDSGQDLVEYGLLTGMVGVGGLLFFLLFSAVMGFKYSTWVESVYGFWEPLAPL